MMTRKTAGLCLRAALEAAGAREADDRRFFSLSHAPAAVDPTRETVFAGEPPTAIAGRDGSVALTLWYAAGPAWEPLRETADWIELGVSTCNYDWSADGRDPTWLTSKLERSPVFRIASSERALAMTVHAE
jgi:hypothetical protein